MIPMVRKLITYEANDGHCASSARSRPPAVLDAAGEGTLTSRMSSVMAIANTPSLNASSRVVSLVCADSLIYIKFDPDSCDMAHSWQCDCCFPRDAIK